MRVLRAFLTVTLACAIVADAIATDTALSALSKQDWIVRIRRQACCRQSSPTFYDYNYFLHVSRRITRGIAFDNDTALSQPKNQMQRNVMTVAIGFRDLHRIPELGFEEKETGAYIR